MRINLCCLLWGVLGVVSAQAEAPAYIGIIEPRQVISVGSAVPGIVEHLPVDRGHVIKKGDLLAELNSDVEAIDHTLAKTRYELMKNRYDRQAALASNALTSQEEVERARIEMELAKLEMERRAVLVEQKSIRSSVNGVVLDRLVREGEYVYEQISIVKVAQINPLNVELLIPITEYGKVVKGMVAEVSVDPPLAGRYLAHVEVVDDVLDVASGTFGVRLVLKNDDARIPSGVKCHVQFPDVGKLGVR